MDLKRPYHVDDVTDSDHPSKRHSTSHDGAKSVVQIDPIPSFKHRSKYTIAWICALHIEMAAAEAMLDEIHEALSVEVNDTNTYTLGSIKQHNVVIACLPAGHYGTINAASVISNLKRSFPSIRAGLMVGIGVGVPSKIDVRLGDVVVGTRVMQCDLGKITGDGEIQRTAIPRIPHQLLCAAVSALRAKQERESISITSILKEKFRQSPHYNRPNLSDDLFPPTYDHQLSTSNCENCDRSKLVPRSKRNDPSIHYGAIASGNQVMRSASQRDAIARELDIICFEMEAAGLMDIIPCLPIRGICDYADSHKNKSWQRYAAATAAAYAREFLSVLPFGDTGVKSSYMVTPCLQASNSRRQQLLEALNFDRKDSRQATIKAAHSKTCRWFIKHPAYEAWLDPEKLTEHRGFLWIRGKPGAGKSTIMKFAYLNMRKARPSPGVTASFFFNARGEDLERSIEGMYRSLTLQLLHGYPRLQSVLDDPDFSTKNLDECPSLDTLKDIFRNAVHYLGHDQFTCFIDALDECDEQQVMDMVQYFEDLVDHSAKKNIGLRICFSSRHYPYIFVRGGIQFTLENQPGHIEDLATYVESRLRVQDPVLRQELRSKLLEKASGVFLWITLVVDILNNEHARGGMALRKRLEEIPTGLYELFSDMLKRDNINREGLLICVLWILCARRPLRPDEFSHAVWSGLLLKGLADSEPPDLTNLSVELSNERYVIGYSKGLAEITNETKDPRVQFIHESVRDFLLKSGGLRELWPDLGFEWEIQSHEKLKQCCQMYISHDSVHSAVKGPLLEVADSSQSDISKTYPFLEYAGQHILYHAEVAGEAISQSGFLLRFNTPEWISIVNRFEKYRARHFTADASLIYILAERDYPNLIREKLHERPKDGTAVTGERFRYPIFTALAHGSKASVAALLNSPSTVVEGIDITNGLNRIQDFRGFKGRTPLTWAAQEGRVGLIHLLLQSGSVIDERDDEGRSALKRALQCEDEVTMTYLIKHGAGLSDRDFSMGTILHEVVSRGFEMVARLLLERGADVNARDSSGTTTLCKALGNEAIVRLLIEHGADVNARSSSGSTALHRASVAGSEAVVRLLIEHGVDVNARDSSGTTALCKASVAGSEAVIRLLIEHGAEVNARDSSRPTVLYNALDIRSEAVVRLLIKHGLVVNARDSSGSTVLHRASMAGSEAVVRLLIEHGAEVNARDSSGSTALHRASVAGSEAVARLLIKHGADFNARDSSGSTALHRASVAGSEAVVRLLIEHGAEINARDSSGSTALHRALGNKAVVMLLIEKGADVNAQDSSGSTILNKALTIGSETVIKHLLEKGAEVNTQNSYESTVLMDS